MAVWAFNKGEWTEAYVFLRLLGDGRIYGATRNFKRDEQTYIDIINIIRDEPNLYLKFERFIENEMAKVRAVNQDNVVFKIITAPELTEKATYLYDMIMSSSAGNRKISIPEMQGYLESLSFTTPKSNLSDSAKDKYGLKTDIIITSQNSLDNALSTEGFSIKSKIGSNPTLFNCSQSSGFVYEVIGCDVEGMHRLNALASLKTIVKTAADEYGLEYAGCRNDIFEENIGIVDSRMDEILDYAVRIVSGYYGADCGVSVEAVSRQLTDMNPLKRRNPEEFYQAKLKDFLFASFAGMTASSRWDGRKRLTGGYIDVSQDGEMLYYRAMSDDIFSNYLFCNTKFDVPDRGVLKDVAFKKSEIFLNEHREMTDSEMSAIIYTNGISGKKRSKKGDFGYIYQDGDKFYIALNFQIRFK